MDSNRNNCRGDRSCVRSRKSDHHEFHSNGITVAAAAITAAIRAATDTTV